MVGDSETSWTYMKFVRTLRNGKEEPYLPGSGLKGVLRSRCEQMAATFLGNDRFATFMTRRAKSSGLQSCTKKVESILPGERYSVVCPICKLFGCGGGWQIGGQRLVISCLAGSLAWGNGTAWASAANAGGGNRRTVQL